MNEDNLNMEIRKFLKKVGITSQRIIENEFNKAYTEQNIKSGEKIDLKMTLCIKSFNAEHDITGEIKID